jgi:hypothetical protein
MTVQVRDGRREEVKLELSSMELRRGNIGRENGNMNHIQMVMSFDSQGVTIYTKAG